MAALNVLPPDAVTRVTDYVPEVPARRPPPLAATRLGCLLLPLALPRSAPLTNPNTRLLLLCFLSAGQPPPPYDSPSLLPSFNPQPMPAPFAFPLLRSSLTLSRYTRTATATRSARVDPAAIATCLPSVFWVCFVFVPRPPAACQPCFCFLSQGQRQRLFRRVRLPRLRGKGLRQTGASRARFHPSPSLALALLSPTPPPRWQRSPPRVQAALHQDELEFQGSPIKPEEASSVAQTNVTRV